MHLSQSSLFSFFIVVLFFSSLAIGQQSQLIDLDSDFYSGIQKVYPSFSLSRAELESAKNLSDLNDRYEKDWIAEYYSVEISTWHDGKLVVSSGPDDTLTDNQLKQMQSADRGVPINVTVEYLPDNSLQVNEKKVLDFECFVEPEESAKFSTDQSLNTYLEDQLLSVLPKSELQGYDLGAYTFTLDEGGHVTEPKIHWASGNPALDSLSIHFLCQMPKWQPAQYATGKVIPESNVLLIGNPQNCMIHTLNLAENRLPKE